jgi:tight adherence protein B
VTPRSPGDRISPVRLLREVAPPGPGKNSEPAPRLPRALRRAHRLVDLGSVLDGLSWPAVWAVRWGLFHEELSRGRSVPVGGGPTMSVSAAFCCLFAALVAVVLHGEGTDPCQRLPRCVPGPVPPRAGVREPRGSTPAGRTRSGLSSYWVVPWCRSRDGTREQSRQACRFAEELAAALRAGLPTVRAWQLLADRPRADPRYRAAAQCLAAGGTAGDGVRALSVAGPFTWLAAVCDLSDRSGAPLAQTLDGFVEALRAEEAARSEVAAAVAGPRATSALLSWLPGAGLALGLLLGVDCLHVLLCTAPGRLCLLVACLLWVTGLAWSSLLVRRAATAADRPTGRSGCPRPRPSEQDGRNLP